MRTVSIQSYESIYSWVVRSHLRYGSAYERHTYKVLFGHSPVSIHPYLPKHIEELCSRTHALPDTLIQQHTLYCLFHFFDETTVHGPSLLRYMLGNKNEKILAFSFIRSARLSTRPSHKFCSACIEELRKEKGFGLYDIRCQLPGIIVCPKHGIFFDCFFSTNGPIVKLRQAKPNSNREKAVGKTASFVQFCFDVIELSINNHERFDRKRYYNTLDRRGYITKEGRVRHKALTRDAVREVSKLVLEPGAEHLCTMYYLGSLLSKRQYSMHPIQHLLFGWWLFEGDASRFYEDDLPPEQYALKW